MPRSDRPPKAPRHTPSPPGACRTMASRRAPHPDEPSSRERCSTTSPGKAPYVPSVGPSWADLTTPHAAASGHRRSAGPAAFPHHGRDLQLRTPGLGVVGVEEQVVHAVVEEDGLVTRAMPVGRGGGNYRGAAALGHRLAVPVRIRAGDFAGTPHHHVVGAYGDDASAAGHAAGAEDI